jgi:hypothetical protein
MFTLLRPATCNPSGMEIKVLKKLMFIAALFVSAGAYAADSNGKYTVIGQGNQSCGAFTGASDFNDTIFGVWIAGFLSGYNNSNASKIANVIAKTDFQGAKAWIRNYCYQHPTAPVAKATNDFVWGMISGAIK